MLTLLDWILGLFRSEDAARAFVAAPEQAMRDAGLAGVTAAQLSSVAATALPGILLGGGDPILGLQRAVSNQYGFAPAYQPSFDPIWAPSPAFAPSPTFAPETNTELASRNDTDFASNNSIPLLSPTQDAGANSQQGGFNLGFGDITLGNKSSNSATDGGVVVTGDSSGDILSGDGAVLGDGTATTAGGDAIATGDSGSVIKGADNSVNNGTSTSVGGSQTSTTVDGTGNTAAADGRELTTTTVTYTETTDTTVTDNSTQDSSLNTLFDVSRDISLMNSDLDNSNDLALASGNSLFGF